MPDYLRLGREPYIKNSYDDMKLLLLLLLGCAVQCPNKESFIERIKTLPIESQHALVHYIKQVLNNFIFLTYVLVIYISKKFFIYFKDNRKSTNCNYSRKC